MKWIGISGTWRTTDPKVEQDVRSAVRDIITRGDGIVSGGATGVDYFALDEALKHSTDGAAVKVALPSTLENYIGHLQAWANGHETGDPSIHNGEMERLVSQLHKLKSLNPAAIIEGPAIPALDIDQKAYDARNSVVVDLSDELLAFQINKSKGTQDTIDKMRAAGKAVTVRSYATAQDKTYGVLKPKF